MECRTEKTDPNNSHIDKYALGSAEQMSFFGYRKTIVKTSQSNAISKHLGKTKRKQAWAIYLISKTKSINSILFYSLVKRVTDKQMKKENLSLTSGSSSKFWESWSCWMISASSSVGPLPTRIPPKFCVPCGKSHTRS